MCSNGCFQKQATKLILIIDPSGNKALQPSHLTIMTIKKSL